MNDGEIAPSMTSSVALCAGGVTPIIPMIRTGMFHLPDEGAASGASKALFSHPAVAAGKPLQRLPAR
jgi:hypothetical protein